MLCFTHDHTNSRVFCSHILQFVIVCVLYVCVCVCACVCVFMPVCVCAPARAFVCVRASVRVCERVCARGTDLLCARELVIIRLGQASSVDLLNYRGKAVSPTVIISFFLCVCVFLMQHASSLKWESSLWT